MIAVVVLYEFHTTSQPGSPDGLADRWNGPARLDEMTKWDLCEGSTRRAQGTKPLPSFVTV